jgi:hypothetical protein
MHPLTPWYSKTTTVLPRSFGKLASTLSLLIMATTAGCSGVQLSDREQAFARQFPYADVNHSLVLHTVEGITETNLDHAVTLQLENHSNRMIAYSTREGIVGAVYDPGSKSWVEAENRVHYPDIQWLLGPRGDDIPSISLVDYSPTLESTPDSLEIRIVVVGHVYDETHGFGEAAAAYLDLTLER